MPEGSEGEADTHGQAADNEDSRDNVIADLYIDAAKHLIASITNPVDKETCLVWVDFIRVNKNEQPVLLDYLMLLLLSLHQDVRSVPFDEIPPPIAQFNDIQVDLFQMGQRIIDANRAYKDKRAQFSRKGQGASDVEGIPLFEWSTGDHDTKDYFVSQAIPGFGRQSYFATTSKEQPFWFPNETEAESGSGDYLTRIAAYMQWLQGKDTSMFDESSRVQESITKRNWWKDFQNMREKDHKNTGKGFKWHPTSILESVKTKLDNKAIEEFFQKAQKKGLAVLSIDERADAGLHDRTFTDADKLSYAPQFKSIFTKRSHGVVNTRRTVSDDMEELVNEKEYNKSWLSGYEADKSASHQSDSFKRTANEHTMRKLQKTGLQKVNSQEEKESYYGTARLGNQPQSSPTELNNVDIHQRGLSWSVPAFRQTFSGGSEGDTVEETYYDDGYEKFYETYTANQEERSDPCQAHGVTYSLAADSNRTYTIGDTRPSDTTYALADVPSRTYTIEDTRPLDATYALADAPSWRYTIEDDRPSYRTYTLADAPNRTYTIEDSRPLDATYTLSDVANRTYTIEDARPLDATYTLADVTNRTYTIEDTQPSFAASTTTNSLDNTDLSGLLEPGMYLNLLDECSGLYTGDSIGYGTIPSERPDTSCESLRAIKERMRTREVQADHDYCIVDLRRGTSEVSPRSHRDMTVQNQPCEPYQADEASYTLGDPTYRTYSVEDTQPYSMQSKIRSATFNTSPCEKTVRFSCDEEQVSSDWSTNFPENEVTYNYHRSPVSCDDDSFEEDNFAEC